MRMGIAWSLTIPPRSARLLRAMVGAARFVHAAGSICMLNTLLALLAVLVVMAAHGVAKLVLLPFRALRDLFRYKGPQAQLMAR